ncbi:MAG TPA: hypothetical protein VF502_18130 [Stellaceae bacterium]
MTAARRGLAILGMAAGLAACGAVIMVDQESPEDIKLHWYNDEGSIDAATGKAERHCQRWSKHAFLVEEFVDDDVTTARFECR